MTRELTLYRGAAVVLVDDEDYDRVAGFRWFVNRGHKSPKIYRKTTDANGRLATVYLHRELTGAPDGVYVKVLNGNAFDCRRSNLVVSLSTKFPGKEGHAYNQAKETSTATGRTPIKRRRRMDGRAIGPVNPGRDVARAVRTTVEEARHFLDLVITGWERFDYDQYEHSDDWNLARRAALDIAERITGRFGGHDAE